MLRRHTRECSADRAGGERPLGRGGGIRVPAHPGPAGGADEVGERLERARHILPGSSQDDRLRPFRDQGAGLVRISEKGHRRRGSGKKHGPETRKRLQRLFGEIRQTAECRTAPAALKTGGEGFAHQPASRGRRDPGRCIEGLLAKARSAQEEDAVLALAQQIGRFARRRVWDAWRWSDGTGLGRPIGRAPETIRRDNEGRDLTGALAGGSDGFGGIVRHRPGVANGADPGRNRPGQREDVGVQGGVGRYMPGGVLTDHVEHRRARAPRVVKIGDPVCESGAEVEQCHCRAIRHSRVSVSRPRADALKEAEDRPYPHDPIHRHDQRHLGRSGIGETYLHAARHGGADQALRPVRRFILIVRHPGQEMYTARTKAYTITFSD